MMVQIRSKDLHFESRARGKAKVVDERLVALSKIERNQIFGFPWVIGVFVLFMSIYAPTATVRLEALVVGLLLLLAPLAYLVGVPVKWLVHSMVAICVLGIIGVSAETGGIYSAQIVWLLLIPVMPLRLVSIKAAWGWLLVCVAILIVFGSLDYQEVMAGFSQSAGSMFTWTLLQHLFLCICMLALPWYYLKTYRQSIAVMRRYNKIIHHKKLELLHEQANKKLFISRVSHEMRTPMNAVMGFSHLLQVQADQYPQAAGVVEHIQITAKHLLTIINGIMDYTQLIDGQLKIRSEDVELQVLMQQTFDMFKERARSMQIEYTCEVSVALPVWVHLDAQRVSQVLMNFLELALQRTFEGFVQFKAQQCGRFVLFTVHDSGVPLGAQDMQLLQSKSADAPDMAADHVNGTALGLSMAKALAQLMGGEVLAENHAGQGASLTLRLPLALIQSSKQDDQTVSASDLHARISHLPVDILVVDDNPVNRLLVQQVIHTQWPLAKVTQAENGQKALTRLSAQKFDLILMDMLMPEMDGIEATQLIRQDPTSPNQWIPVLGLTANISTEDHVRCLTAGMNDVLLKPFDRQVLIQRMETLLVACPFFSSKYAHQLQSKL